MGGTGSGLRTGRATVGECMTISMPLLMRSRRDGPAWAGEWQWSRAGSSAGRVAFRCSLAGEAGTLMLLWHTVERRTGERELHRQTIAMVSTPQPFGGWRWWFICPRWGGRLLRLHYPPGGPAFADRKALGLSYRSQRESEMDRCGSSAMAIRKALGGDMSHGFAGRFPSKPRWMRWTRYEAMRARAEADGARRTMLLPSFRRFTKRVGIEAAGSD